MFVFVEGYSQTILRDLPLKDLKSENTSDSNTAGSMADQIIVCLADNLAV